MGFNLVQYFFFKTEIDIIENTYEDLSRIIIDISENREYLDQHEWDSFNKKYFFNRDDKDGFQLIRENIKSIYDTIPTA